MPGRRLLRVLPPVLLGHSRFNTAIRSRDIEQTSVSNGVLNAILSLNLCHFTFQ